MRNFTAILVLGFAASLRASTPAPDFQAFVDGKPLELHGFTQGSFGLFEIAKPVEVEIQLGFDVRWVNVRPLSAHVGATIGPDHRSVRFRMTGPVPLTVEFNDDLTRVVHLLCYAPEKDARAPGAGNVRYFGPGVHEAGLIELKDNETLYLAPGAWVKGNVRSVGTHDVAILGRGVLDGSEVSLRPRAGPDVPYGDGTRNLVYLEGTVGARIEGVTLFNIESAWTVYMTGTKGTRVDGVRILNPSVHYGDDGFDVDSSSDVLIENVFVRTNDDCVVVKNMRDLGTDNITVRHAVLWNMPTGGNGIEVGFETRSKPTHDIHFQDIDIIHVERGAAISIHNGDAATVENVTYDDIRVEDARRKLFDFAVVYAQYGADKPASAAENSQRLDRGGTWDGLLSYSPEEKPERAKFRGHIRNVRVTNLHVVDGSLPYSVVAGFDQEHGIENVLIEGLEYQGRPILNAADAKCVIENALGVEFK
jgi:Glycosyl hydrolases family 28